MKNVRLARTRGYSLIGVLFVAGFIQTAGAQAQAPHQHTVSPEDRDQTNALVRIVRDSTRRFQDISVALAAGYVPRFGCVSGSHEGAMGLHLVHDPLVADGVLEPTRPELLVYEPIANGRFRLVAADYLVLSETWHATNPAPPELAGQLFHLFDSPNRFGLPAFYTLHVWAWKDNPQGTFANWNPRVSCDHYTGQNP